jgi:hypothetical protein
VTLDRVVFGLVICGFLGTTSFALAGPEPTTGARARTAAAPAAVQPSACVAPQQSFWLFDWFTRSKEASNPACVTPVSAIATSAPLILGTGF